MGGTEWVLDVAHNPAGAWALRAGLRSILEGRAPRALVFSCLRDKPLGEMAQILFPLFDRVIVTPIHSARAAAVEDLLAAAKATGTAAVAAGSVREALENAQEQAAGGVVVVSGSVYLVGEARTMLMAGLLAEETETTMSARPNPLPRLYRWRSNVLQMPILMLWTAACGSAALLVSFVDKKGRVQHGVARLWARGAVRVPLSRLKVEGAENLEKHPVAVYAPNHTSYMDIPVLFAALPFQFRILAKKELWQWPFIGWYLERSGQMPIDIANPHVTLSSLGGAVKALRAGMPLVVFPEGGRTSDGELRPFLSGAAYLAIRAQVPLVPIALKGVYDLLPIHTHHLYPGELTVQVGEPIETKGMSVRQNGELTDRLREAMEAMLSEPVRTEAETPATVS